MAYEPFTILKSSGVPLPIENVDTDQIIPARFLKATERKGFGDNLFRDWRYNQDNTVIKDFVLNNPTYKGKILNPVVGWTSHHSICEFKGKWYLFYHDSSLSKGVTHLRSVKIAEIKYNDDGTIQTLEPYGRN